MPANLLPPNPPCRNRDGGHFNDLDRNRQLRRIDADRLADDRRWEKHSGKPAEQRQRLKLRGLPRQTTKWVVRKGDQSRELLQQNLTWKARWTIRWHSVRGMGRIRRHPAPVQRRTRGRRPDRFP